MKQLLTKLTGLGAMILFAGIFVFAMSCEGPEGTAGTAGTDGKDGGTASCETCHNTTTLIKSKIVQYETSQHFLGTAYGRGSSATCAPCHSSEGFSLVAAGEEVTEGFTNPTPVNCRTCHTIHKNFDMTDFAAITVAPVTLTGTFTNGKVVDIGKGNLCVNCHQSRLRTYDDLVIGGDSATVSSSHYGPHYGTPSNVLVGAGLFEVPGSVAYPGSAHPHESMVTDGCVTCHMHNGTHNWHPNDDACAPCHTDLSGFDFNNVQTDVQVLMDQLKDLLVAADLASEEDGEVHPHRGTIATANQVGALFNYMGLLSDGSLGVHNAKYVKAILTNSIEAFD